MKSNFAPCCEHARERLCSRFFGTHVITRELDESMLEDRASIASALFRVRKRHMGSSKRLLQGRKTLNDVDELGVKDAEKFLQFESLFILVDTESKR